MSVHKVILIIAMICIVASGPLQARGKDFASFWPNFRKAALRYDYDTLNKMTQFPFEVESEDDESVNQYPKEQFPKIFEKMLFQSVYAYDGDKEVQIKFYDQLRQLTDMDLGDENITSISIGQFVFMFIDGRWMLVKAYYADE